MMIPGPLLHLPISDSLVIANSNLEIECYKFTSLKSATDNKINAQKEAYAATEDGKSAQKQLNPDWISNIGEQAMHMVLHLNQYSNSHDIVVSCEQQVFILTDQGEIRYQRRLDFMPSCLKTYHLPKAGADVFNEDGDQKIVSYE